METQKLIDKLVEDLRNNKVVCFKTDTIYGLSCNAFSESAINKLSDLKKRKENKHYICLISKNFDYEKIVKVSKLSKKLIEKFWAGPLTLIFEPKGKSLEIPCFKKEISLRMPNDAFCQKLLEELDFPIISTSANISDYPSENDPDKLKEMFPSILICDCGKVKNINPSTLVDARGEEIKIIRVGQISEQQILDALKD